MGANESNKRVSASREETELRGATSLKLWLSRAGLGACLLVICVLLIWPVSAHVRLSINRAAVCACCADEGEWYERTERVQTEQLALLDRLRFSPTAKKYMSPGEDNDLSEDYSLSQIRAGRSWQLKFRDDRGRTGTISFMIPVIAVTFGADLHDSPAGGVGPSLYKEWRFSGAARVAGIFRSVMSAPVQFRLILQGRGNHCENAEDYRHWTLQISSGHSSHAFYGSLNDPAT